MIKGTSASIWNTLRGGETGGGNKILMHNFLFIYLFMLHGLGIDNARKIP